MESINAGKLFPNAYLMDLGGCIKTLRYCAGWADKTQGRTMPVGEQRWGASRGRAEGARISTELNNFKLFLLKMSAK